MSGSRRPRLGRVVGHEGVARPTVPALGQGASGSAALAHDPPFGGEGLFVELSAAKGLTSKSVLWAPFRFQAPPLESLKVTSSHVHTDYDTIRAGQFSRPQGPQLRTVQMQSLAVDYPAMWQVWEGSFDVSLMTSYLAKIRNAGTPFWLLAYSPRLWGSAKSNIHMLCTLREMTSEEKAGEPDARYWDLTFHEYRVPVVARAGLGASKAKGALHLPARVLVTAATTTTLHRLATKYYGSAAKWREIGAANPVLRGWSGGRSLNQRRAQVGHNFHIVIPKLPSAEATDWTLHWFPEG